MKANRPRTGRPPRGFREKWGEFNRKHGLRIFIVIATIAVVILVGFLMWILGNPNYHPGR